MFISLKANKKRIIAFVVLVAIVIGACLMLGNRNKGKEVVYPAGTNEERITFLSSFGWEVESEPIEMREVMIPQTFNDVYTTYNDMQKAQGFDLKPYAGYNCMQYKYLVHNYPSEREIYATLLVYDSKVIGGDLACADVDGFMRGFAANSAFYGETANNENGAAIEENENSAGSAAENSANENNAAENNPGAENASESSVLENAENNAAENNNAADNQANADAESTAETDAVPDADIYPTD